MLLFGHGASVAPSSRRPNDEIARERRGGCCGWPLFLARRIALCIGLLGGVVLPWSTAYLDRQPAAGVPGRSCPSLPPTPTPIPTPTPHAPVPTPTPTPLPVQLVIPPKSREVARLYNGIQVRCHLRGGTRPPGQPGARKPPPATRSICNFPSRCPSPRARRPRSPTARPRCWRHAAEARGAAGERPRSRNSTTASTRTRPNSCARTSRTSTPSCRATFSTTPIPSLKSRTPTPSASCLLIQSDMDVDSDGSDPDRLNEVDTAVDPTFQPLTSYKWAKRGTVPNPLLKPSPRPSRPPGGGPQGQSHAHREHGGTAIDAHAQRDHPDGARLRFAHRARPTLTSCFPVS